MWIFSQERGLINLDSVSRITFDKNGTFLGIRDTVIVVCHYDASEKIIQAIKNNQNYVEV